MMDTGNRYGGHNGNRGVTLIAESAELAPMQHSNYCRACYNASDGQKMKRNYFITIAGMNPNPEP